MKTTNSRFRVLNFAVAATLSLSASIFTALATDCAPPPSGLVSWWPGDGNANDIQGGNNGNLGGVTFVPGEVGQAFHFDGGSWVTTANEANLSFERTNAFSIDAWIRTTYTSENVFIVSKRQLAAPFKGYALDIDNGQLPKCYPTDPTPPGAGWLQFFLDGSDTTDCPRDHALIVYATTSVNDGQWHHVAATYDGSGSAAGVTLYIDGAARTNLVISDNLGANSIANSQGFTIGAGTGNGPAPFIGDIDEIDVFNRVISPAEIQAIVNAGAAGKCEPMAQVEARNLVLNPGFELDGVSLIDQAPQGWNFAPASGGDFVVDSSDSRGDTPRSGSFWAGFSSASGQNDTISQTIPTVPGGVYDFSFWVNNLSGEDASYLTASWGATAVLQITPGDNVAANGWTRFDFIVIATGTNTTINFSGRNAASQIGLDDVSATPVSSAAANTLVQSAFDTGLDGWTSTNTAPEITWNGGGGNPGGFAQFSDGSANATSVNAPAKFLGSFSALDGTGSIQFDHKIIAETGVTGFFPYQIWLYGPGGAATWAGNSPTGVNDWTTLTVPLNANTWTVTSGAWPTLLTNVNFLQIEIELVQNSNFAADTDIEGIDNVKVVEVLPVLNIQPAINNNAIVSWPSVFANFVLQESPALNPTNWIPSTNTVSQLGGANEVVVESATNTLFFRLTKTGINP
jgi:hypothetical protein